MTSRQFTPHLDHHVELLSPVAYSFGTEVSVHVQWYQPAEGRQLQLQRRAQLDPGRGRDQPSRDRQADRADRSDGVGHRPPADRAGDRRESGSLPSAGGKPRTTLRINPTAAYAVGIHFDPIEVSVVVVDMMGRRAGSLAPRDLARASSRGADRRGGRSRPQAPGRAGIPDERVLGVGAACPGPIDQSQGLVISPPRRDRWTEVPIKRLLERYIGFDVIMDNDANAAAIGERWSGHGRTVSDFAFLYMGTGIGGAMFLSNHIYRGVSLECRRVWPHRRRAKRDPVLLR